MTPMDTNFYGLVTYNALVNETEELEYNHDNMFTQMQSTFYTMSKRPKDLEPAVVLLGKDTACNDLIGYNLEYSTYDFYKQVMISLTTDAVKFDTSTATNNANTTIMDGGTTLAQQ